MFPEYSVTYVPGCSPATLANVKRKSDVKHAYRKTPSVNHKWSESSAPEVRANSVAEAGMGFHMYPGPVLRHAASSIKHEGCHYLTCDSLSAHIDRVLWAAIRATDESARQCVPTVKRRISGRHELAIT